MEVNPAGVSDVHFVCNVCDGANTMSRYLMDRETGVCSSCGANVRMRAIALLAGIAAHDRTDGLPAWPSDSGVRVAVLGDPSPLDDAFAAKFDYAAYRFDIRHARLYAGSPEDVFPRGPFDIVVCNEVLARVPPPVAPALARLFDALKPGGTLVLTVPYSLGDTREHFERLNEWAFGNYDDDPAIFNATTDGHLEILTDLRFHDADHRILEMRVFGFHELLEHLRDAGFRDVDVRRDDDLHYGIVHRHPWSLPIVARRPA